MSDKMLRMAGRSEGGRARPLSVGEYDELRVKGREHRTETVHGTKTLNPSGNETFFFESHNTYLTIVVETDKPNSEMQIVITPRSEGYTAPLRNNEVISGLVTDGANMVSLERKSFSEYYRIIVNNTSKTEDFTIKNLTITSHSERLASERLDSEKEEPRRREIGNTVLEIGPSEVKTFRVSNVSEYLFWQYLIVPENRFEGESEYWESQVYVKSEFGGTITPSNVILDETLGTAMSDGLVNIAGDAVSIGIRNKSEDTQKYNVIIWGIR